MASIYTCNECGTNLNLQTTHLYPSDVYFEAGNKNTLSFASIDSTKFKFEPEDKIRPFFETLNYWGIQRKRTKIKCNSCSRLLGYIYDDGQPLTDGIGQFGFGPSQVIPRAPRYRFKTKALRITYENDEFHSLPVLATGYDSVLNSSILVNRIWSGIIGTT